jgi:hypothetical protein
LIGSIAEIEAAIEKLLRPQVDELAEWLEQLRVGRATPTALKSWLARARGAAGPWITTADVMSLTSVEK